MAKQVRRVRTMLSHCGGNGVRNHERQVVLETSRQLFSIGLFETVPNEVIYVSRRVPELVGRHRLQRGSDSLESLIAPRSEVVEAPLSARERLPLIASCIGKVCQVRVLQQMDWSEPALLKVVRQRGHR